MRGGRRGRGSPRAFTVGVPGPVHPCGDVAVLLVNRELSGSSVQCSGSGDPGETVTIAVRAGDGLVRVEVTDRRGPEYRSLVLPRVTRKMAGASAAVAAAATWRRPGAISYIRQIVPRACRAAQDLADAVAGPTVRPVRPVTPRCRRGGRSGHDALPAPAPGPRVAAPRAGFPAGRCRPRFPSPGISRSARGYTWHVPEADLQWSLTGAFGT